MNTPSAPSPPGGVPSQQIGSNDASLSSPAASASPSSTLQDPNNQPTNDKQINSNNITSIRTSISTYITAFLTGVQLTSDGLRVAAENIALRQIYKKYMMAMFIAAIVIYAIWFAILIPMYITVVIMEFILHMAIWVWLSPALHAWFFEFLLFAPLIGMLIIR
jgi:hypothetical protein